MKWRLNTYNNQIGFNDLPFMIVGIPILAILVSMIFFGITIRQSVECFAGNISSSLIITSLFWIGDRYIICNVRKRYTGVSNDTKRLYVQGILVVVYTAVMSVFLMWSEPLFNRTFGDNVIEPGYPKSFITCLFATALITAIYEAAYYISRWKESIAEAERLKKENTIAQLESLKSQVNPHFLFNSLNTLASIIPEDADRSVEFVQKLSSVYRCILDINERSVITLEEELDCLKNYVFLLETRFGENLKIKMNIAKDAGKRFIVPLSIQMLIENAIKHNVVSSKRPLHILLNASLQEVVVENNLQLKEQHMEGTKTGLKNISNRYKLTCDKEIDIVKSDGSFRVTLPLMEVVEYEKGSALHKTQ